MKIAVFDTHRYDQTALTLANKLAGHQLQFFEARLTAASVELAVGCDAVCPFVNCRLVEAVLKRLMALGSKLVTLRAAGYNGIDVAAAQRLGIVVTRVPAYSPHAVAEHAFALLLCLLRKLHRAHARVRELNFSLDGLEGFELYGKTFGCVGVGRIGAAAIGIARGFGCRVLAHDVVEDALMATRLGFTYTSLNELLAESDVVSLHVPLTPQSRHLIDAPALAHESRRNAHQYQPWGRGRYQCADPSLEVAPPRRRRAGCIRDGGGYILRRSLGRNALRRCARAPADFSQRAGHLAPGVSDA